MISFLLTIENEKARSKLEEIYETYHKDMYITAFSILKNHHESIEEVWFSIPGESGKNMSKVKSNDIKSAISNFIQAMKTDYL
jgi:hypothetical protein